MFAEREGDLELLKQHNSIFKLYVGEESKCIDL